MKKNIVFGLGLLFFAILTFVGLKFVWYDDVACVIITFLCLGLLGLFVFGLKKIKTVETKFETWKIVEISTLSIFVLLLLLFINVPMNRTLIAFSEKKNLEELAKNELRNIEQALVDYIEQEKDAINKTINSLRSVIGCSTNSGFDNDSKNYIDFLVNEGYNGMIREVNVNEYETLLQDIFIYDHEDYFNTKKNNINIMKKQEWGIFDLYNILDYSEKIDELYKDVEKKLTSFSCMHHSENEYPYKFVITKDAKGRYIIDNNEITEFKYDIPNDILYNCDQSDFMTEVEIITFSSNFSILSVIINIVIIIMILFPYLMANRSTKVMIKRMKNNKDLGGQDL